MEAAIQQTNFQFPGQVSKYEGKVRDVYNINEDFLVIVSSDRISAFDHILPKAIPYKGQVLNQTSGYFFKEVEELVPTHVVAIPDPNVTIGLKCKPYPIEVVVRNYLAGHAWRTYKSGKRSLCGVALPDGLKESDKLPEPIITPATKSQIGHDEDISEEEILKSKIIDPDEWAEIKHYAMELFQKGTELAAQNGLILVDTKYEFGNYGDKIFVIDEIHTPDSSRYFYADTYSELQAQGKRQRQLSKEFVREWLMTNGFQGLEGQNMPHMPEDFISSVTDRYIELYNKVTGQSFHKGDNSHIHERIMDNVLPALQELSKIAR